MPSQHSKKHRHADAPNIVPDPLVDSGNPSHRYQARSTAHLDRPRSRMVALAASPPGPRSPRSPQTETATVMLVQRTAGAGSAQGSHLYADFRHRENLGDGPGLDGYGLII